VLERGYGCSDGAVDVLGARERVRRPRLAGGGVESVEGRARRRFDVLAGDVEAVLRQLRLLSVG
jgi:hypothetical protein